MTRLVLLRLLSAIPVLFGIVVISFIAMRLVPGDAVDVILMENYSPEREAYLRQLFGLDMGLFEQFFRWVGGVMRGDLGFSFRTGRPVTTELAARFPPTVSLAVISLTLSLLFAIPAGVVSALKRNSILDYMARGSAMVGLSVPNFFLGVLLILVFAVQLRWLPAGGYTGLTVDPVEHFRRMILPAVTLATSLAAVTTRMTRSSMLEVLELDYVRTARAKGLSRGETTRRHALRNASIPVVTVIGMQVGALLGGVVVIEKVFSIPGLGSLVVDSIFARDYPVVQAAVILLASAYLVSSLLVDIAYLFLNPRLRDA